MMDELREIDERLARIENAVLELQTNLQPVIDFMQGMQHTVENHPMLRKLFAKKGE